MRREDVVDVAAIAAQREGTTVDRWRGVFERLCGESERSVVLVATLGDAVVAYGKAEHFTPPAGSAANVTPEGWYLGGVVVRPEHRRRGIGTALTRERMRWLAERTSVVYYIANERNRVSIELHAALGFEERTRDFVHPGVSFEGGVGILFACDLPPRTPAPRAEA